MSSVAEKVKPLIRNINSRPGSKVLTLTCPNGSFTVDVSNDGVFGYKDGTFEMFCDKLVNAMMSEGSGLLIRQITGLKNKVVDSRGSQWLPIQKMYAVKLENNSWFPLSAGQVEWCCCIDAQGNHIEKEKMVRFCEFVPSRK